MNKLTISRFSNTKEVEDVRDQLQLGEIVFDLATGLHYCKHENKLGIMIEERFSPCLGSQCDKAKYCFKYNLAKKFSPDKFIMRDFSVETEMVYDELENYRGTYICCGKDTKHKYFVWNE